MYFMSNNFSHSVDVWSGFVSTIYCEICSTDCALIVPVYTKEPGLLLYYYCNTLRASVTNWGISKRTSCRALDYFQLEAGTCRSFHIPLVTIPVVRNDEERKKYDF